MNIPFLQRSLAPKPPSAFRRSLRRGITALNLLLVGCICGGSVVAVADPFAVDKEAFWRPGPSTPPELSAQKLFPAGRKFLFSFYSVGGGQSGGERLSEQVLQELFTDYRKSGFEIIGPQYELNDRILSDADAHGFQVVYPVGFSKKEVRERSDLTKEEIRQYVIEQVKAVADDPRVVLWDLKPEELRPWRRNEIDYLATAAQAIRDTDPLKRPIYHYMPGHFSAAMMKRVAPHVDVVGKGMYTNYSSQKDSRIWCKWSIDEEIAAIRESGSNAVPIAVPEMFQQPTDDELKYIPDWVRHDVYLGLVSGAKGVLVFSMRQRDGFTAWQEYYDAYKQVGAELLGDDNLAQVFLFGEPRSDLAVEITDGPDKVEMVFPQGKVGARSYASVNFADIVYGEDRYLIAVNSASKPVGAVVSGFPYDSARALPLSGNSREPFNIAEGEFAVSFAPLEVKIWKFSRK